MEFEITSVNNAERLVEIGKLERIGADEINYKDNEREKSNLGDYIQQIEKEALKSHAEVVGTNLQKEYAYLPTIFIRYYREPHKKSDGVNVLKFQPKKKIPSYQEHYELVKAA